MQGTAQSMMAIAHHSIAEQRTPGGAGRPHGPRPGHGSPPEPSAPAPLYTLTTIQRLNFNT